MRYRASSSFTAGPPTLLAGPGADGELREASSVSICCCMQHLHPGEARGAAGGCRVRQGRIPGSAWISSWVCSLHLGSRAGAGSIPRIPAWRAFSGFPFFLTTHSPRISPSCLNRTTLWPPLRPCGCSLYSVYIRLPDRWRLTSAGALPRQES